MTKTYKFKDKNWNKYARVTDVVQCRVTRAKNKHSNCISEFTVPRRHREVIMHYVTGRITREYTSSHSSSFSSIGVPGEVFVSVTPWSSISRSRICNYELWYKWVTRTARCTYYLLCSPSKNFQHANPFCTHWWCCVTQVQSVFFRALTMCVFTTCFLCQLHTHAIIQRFC